MSKQIELERLDRAIKDGQIRICTVKNNIDVLDKEIETLSQLEIQLEENLKFLKKKNVTVIAEEFKKAKDDLKRTKVRLITSKNEREDYKKSLTNVNKVIADAQEEIEKINKGGDNNVLHGNFGKKDNG